MQKINEAADQANYTGLVKSELTVLSKLTIAKYGTPNQMVLANVSGSIISSGGEVLFYMKVGDEIAKANVIINNSNKFMDSLSINTASQKKEVLLKNNGENMLRMLYWK